MKIFLSLIFFFCLSVFADNFKNINDKKKIKIKESETATKLAPTKRAPKYRMDSYKFVEESELQKSSTSFKVDE